MIDVTDAKVKEALLGIHGVMGRKVEGRDTDREDIILENRVLEILCRDPDCGPARCARRLKDRYGLQLSGDEVTAVLRGRRIANPEERRELFRWGQEVAARFPGALEGNRADFDAFDRKRGEPALSGGRRHKLQERVAALMIYVRCPEIDVYGDGEKLRRLGTTLAKYFFHDMADVVASVYGFRDGKEEDGDALACKQSAQRPGPPGRPEDLPGRLREQSDGEPEEDRQQMMADFFARLNSERYGYLLDELLAVSRGAMDLRRREVEVPVEISGLLILVRKLVRFVRECRIEPMLQVGSTRSVRAADVEFCDYEGTPFLPEERKVVRVLSPGWVFCDSRLQISRPKVREVKEEMLS